MAKNQDEEVLAGESIEEVGSDPRVYELGFHLDPELASEEVKKAYQEIRAFIETLGTIVAEGDPEKIQLAYTISRQDTAGRRDFDSAYFAWIVYEATPANHAEILTSADVDKRIIRFIDLLTDKDAARHSVEMRELSLKTSERVDEPDASASAELDAALENVVV
ncbi:MAG: 30S ribosomal protein S6 [Patescibacteria group bacterium]|nr:30S ribosomal protein S6 [Patescibacteria group bacterium]